MLLVLTKKLIYPIITNNTLTPTNDELMLIKIFHSIENASIFVLFSLLKKAKDVFNFVIMFKSVYRKI
jgi:hypothetical protein